MERATLTVADGDVVVIAQKIISKAEGRHVNLEVIAPSVAAIKLARRAEKDPRVVELILQESAEVLRVRPGLIIVEHRLGFVCANAGIDHSNVTSPKGEGDDWVLLLPENPDLSAEKIRASIVAASGQKIGVLIIDSHGRPWRLGTIGVAIGIAGLPGLVDLRGQDDLFGFRLQSTEVGVADELAGAASLLMGQAAEGTPVVHIRGLPYPLRDGRMVELLRPKDMDLFR
jgi:coenzyme F420-0:L-glutamate ligase/coenzyme F420-1:gamma-L-glutamate ligase